MSTIAIVANTSWYIYNFRKNTINELKNKGFEIIIVSPVDAYTDRLKALGTKHYELNIDSSGLNPFKDIRTFFSFISIYKCANVKIILNFTPKINIYSTLASMFFPEIKVINNIAGLGTVFTKNNILSIFVRLLYKISQRRANFIFFQNEDDRKLFLKYKLTSINKTDRLPGSGVDLNRFSSLNENNNNGTLSFLLVCRMLKQKGVVEFMDAAKILKAKYNGRVKFNMLGFLDDNNPNYVSKYEMDKWISIGCVSYLGISDCIENVISKHDCIVLPSYYREGVPKSLLEAAAMSKPIITTNNVGCRDIVDDGINGFLCKPGDTTDLIDKIEKIILMPLVSLHEMGRASRLKVEAEFDEKIVINKYIDKIMDLSQDVKCLKHD